MNTKQAQDGEKFGTFDRLLDAMANGDLPTSAQKKSSTRKASSADGSASCGETQTRQGTSKGASR